MFEKMVQWVVCSLHRLLSSLFLWYLGVLGTTIYFSNKSRVGVISFLANSLSPNDPIFKAWEYGMILYFIEIPDPKSLFFLQRTKFQQCVFKMIHWIRTSRAGPTKIPVWRCLHLEVYSALIEYENRKAKPVHYFFQIVDYNNLNDQRQE